MMMQGMDDGHGPLAYDLPDAPAPEVPTGADAEAMLLSCLLWTDDLPAGDVAYVLDYLHPKDFFSPFSGAVFGVMRALTAEGLVLNAAEVARWVAEHPDGVDVTWPGGAGVELMLAELAGLGGVPAAVVYWADQVLGQSYRRQYQQATTRLVQIGKVAAESDLFDALAEVGAQQRRAKARRDGFMSGVPDVTTGGVGQRSDVRQGLVEVFAGVGEIISRHRQVRGAFAAQDGEDAA
ncbi:DnaB-like helicase N-terminal domain-containing protein [Corynebacterium bovis]|uniref:DnaB-like helicase N-terminal domain-containing protein n=1 Tax=Corynebacterium bovis TaxID=36808 RepID=UPI0031388BEF